MKNLKKLFSQYECKLNIHAKKDLTGLSVFPTDGVSGLAIHLYGSFDHDELDAVNITDFSTVGVKFDIVRDEEIDENLYFNMTEAMLEGKYRYMLKNNSIRDKLSHGAVYFTIGNEHEPLVRDFRCTDQRTLKQMYREGKLKTTAYKRVISS